MLSLALRILRQEWRLAVRHPAEIVNPLGFFLLVLILFPLALGPEPQLLSRLAPGIIWVTALLASLLSFERLFRDDWADGSLEQWLLLPQPLPWLVLCKVLAHWSLSGLPLVLCSPLLALLLSLDMSRWLALMWTLLLGTPILSLLGAVGVALTLGLRKGGLLLSLLILPLYIPVLIFATSALEAASLGLPYLGQLAILGAQLLLALCLMPLAIAGALRISLH